MYDIYENAKVYFPSFVAKAYAYEYRGDFEVLLKYEDGSYMLYDDLDHTIRELPMRDGFVTGSDCKREFGRRLRRMLRIKGFTQDMLSAETGITQSSISMYISGKTMPSFYKIDKIAKALNCSVDEFRCY